VDVYKDVTYILDEDGYASSEYQDVVRKRFVKAWEGLIEGYKVRHYSLSCLYFYTKFLGRIPLRTQITDYSLDLLWMCLSSRGRDSSQA
jgi:hypothetical protein